MNNSAGLFQVDELLKKKLLGSGIEKYIKIWAYTKRRKEKRLIKDFEIN
jgi:metal-dependent HD superfamily phosphatase/phosphodiesterase